MSTALNSFWPDTKSTGLLAGSVGGYSYADLLEEVFGPARALNVEGQDELFEAVEKLLGEEDKPPPRGDTQGYDSPIVGPVDLP